MMRLVFGGWFQCRLPTDPDPHDEPRGVSGYVHAYADEPNLDRIVHWQAPSFTRACAPTIGVTVRQVLVADSPVADHPLLAAKLSLLDDPMFEGRNGVIADDGAEPVYPFHLLIVSPSGIRLQRHVVPSDPDFPYSEYFAAGVEGGPEVAREIAEATGVADLKAIWQQRLATLQGYAAGASGVRKVGLDERIAVLSRWLGQPGSPVRFFGARMSYDYTLRSVPLVEGWPGDLPTPASDRDWRVKFWLGGWDADVLCGFCSGTLDVPTSTSSEREVLVGARGDDRDRLMMRGSR